MPPDAEPVNAERIFVDRASETSGPPSMDNTQSRTISNAGTAATTAPKPTRLATLSTGRAEALAPASTVSRSAGSRRWLNATRMRMAEISATITDQTPLTDESGMLPHRASARKLVSRRGSTHMDMARLTRITTISGRMATRIEGPDSL